jgi:SAM-dependent methyltransferase
MSSGCIEELGSMDIYLIDQLMKRRISKDSLILDAGFGKGRNLEYFIRNAYSIQGIDHNPDYLPLVIENTIQWNPAFEKDRLIIGKVESMPYESDHFDFVFSIAVLHFASSHEHFYAMLNEMLRVTKAGGYLLFRMTSWHTFDLEERNTTGLVNLQDGLRYMLAIEDLKVWAKENGVLFVDPIKTTNVDGHRTMTTIVIQK